MTTKHTWIRLFTFLWICDTILTTLFVQKYGTEMEANILPRMVMESFGLIGFWFMKLGIWLFWIYTNSLYKQTKSKDLSYLYEVSFCIILLPVCIASLLIVLGHN